MRPHPLFQEPKRTRKAKTSHEQHQRIFWTTRRVTGHYPVKQGFWGECTHKGPTSMASERSCMFTQGVPFPGQFHRKSTDTPQVRALRLGSKMMSLKSRTPWCRGVRGSIRLIHSDRRKIQMNTIAFSSYCGVQNDYVLGFIICEIFTVITLQDWVGWGIFTFTVIPGYPRRASGDSQLIRGMLRFSGWAPVRIISHKKLQDRALFEIIR